MAGLEFHVTAENSDFLNKMKQVQDKASESVKKVENEGKELDAIFGKIGKELAAIGAGFTVTKLVSDIVRVRGEFQQLEIAMETMLGSQEKATALMSQLTTTAAKTPFGLTDIAQGAKQLLAYGTASEDVNDTLVRLGNIASGLSIPLNDLVYLYGTTMTQGRLFTHDLRQFMGRGIPLADELAKQFGVTKNKNKIGEMVTEGKVGFREVEKAIHAMTNEGGKFYNLMEKQSSSLTGQISNLEDAWDMMLNEIGTKTQGLASGAIDTASLLIENYEKVGKIVLEIAGVYGTYKAALAVGAAVQKVNTFVMEEAALAIQLAAQSNHNLSIQQARATASTKLLTLAKQKLITTMKGLGKALTNPYVLAAAAVTALGYGIYKLITYQTDAEKAQKRLDSAFSEASASAGSEIKKLDELKGRLSAVKKGSTEYYEIKEEIVKNFGKYDSTLADEIERVGDLSTTYDNLTTAIQNSANARMYDKYVEEETDNYDKNLSEKLEKLRESIYNKKGLATEDAARIYSKIWKSIFQGEALDDETKEVIKSFDKVHRVVDDNGDVYTYTTNAVDSLINSINGLNASYDAFIKKAKETFGLGADMSDFNTGLKKLTEEELNKTKKELENVLAKFRETKQEQSYSLVSGEDITFATEQQINDAIANVDTYLEQIKANRLKNNPTDPEVEKETIKKAENAAKKVEEAAGKAEYNLKKAQTKDEIKLIEEERDYKIQALRDELAEYKAIYAAAGKQTDELENKFQRMIEIERKLADIEISNVRKEKAKDDKAKTDELLKEFESYQQAVERIEKEYNEKRKKMYESDGVTFKAGFGQENVEELERQKTEAIEQVADTFATRTEAFKTWADSLSYIAIDELKQMLVMAKAQLELLKSTEGVNELDIAQAEAAVEKIENVLGESGKVVDYNKVKWTELSKTLSDSAEAFEKIGEIVPGVAGDVLSGVAGVAASSVEVANGIKAIGDAVSAAEKASAILAVVSAVVKVVEKFTSVVKKNDEANEKAAEAGRNYAEALEDLKESAAIESNDTIFGQNVFGALLANAEKAKDSFYELKRVISEGVAAIEEMAKVDLSWADVNTSGIPGVDNSIMLDVDMDSLIGQSTREELKKKGTEMASDLRTSWQQFWGSSKNQSVFDISTLYNKAASAGSFGEVIVDWKPNVVDTINEEKMLEFEAWYKEWGDGLSKENKDIAEEILKEWHDYQEAMEAIKQSVSSFFSDVTGNVASSMLDTWIETGNAIADATALVNDYATALAKAAVQSMLQEKVFKNAEEEMLSLMMAGDYTGATELIKGLIDQANEYAPAIAKIFEEINAASGGVLENAEEDTRNAYKKEGITASQDSVDRVDARLTTMQGHTYSMNESCKTIANNSSQIVSRLTAIERNTSYLLAISSNMESLRSDIQDIKNKGIPML